MALFDVAGWDLKSTQVKAGVQNKKKSNKRKQKDREAAKAQAEADAVEAIEAETPETTESTETTKNTEEAVTNKDTIEEPKSKKQKKQKKAEPVKSVTPLVEAAPATPTLDLAPATKLTPLQQKMMAKLTGSRFRWINEQLYTITSDAALKLVKEQPSLFDEYHDGFRSQVQSWPENPVDVFVNQIRERSARPVNAPGGLPGHRDTKKIVIADMGCGEAQFALDVQTFVGGKGKGKGKKFKGSKLDVKVHSFDLKKGNDRITVADIRNVPLPDESCNIVVFCLALMGTNFLDFIQEAYRILAPNGELWIAEIKSRFGERDGKGDEFVEALKLMGFFHKKTDDENKMFTRFEFFKPPQNIIAERRAKLERRQKFIEQEDEKEQLQKRREKTPEGKWLLKPCIYKRR